MTSVALLILSLLTIQHANSFHSLASPILTSRVRAASSSFLLRASTDEKNKEVEDDDVAVNEDMNPLTRASWYAVEAFGNVFGSDTPSSPKGDDVDADLSQPPKSLKEALRRIELDNERQYFLSGEVDVLAYDEDCVFADPFVSFSGRKRFVDNLANLGSFITKYDARMLGYDVSDDGTTVTTKVMVKLELNLPWKPVLAWPWGVTYDIDPETCLITNHEESWDIEPLEGVKQIFRKPTVKITGNKDA